MSSEKQPKGPRGKHRIRELDGILVQCPRFRCLAYIDDTGCWRNLFDDSLLEEPVEVIEKLKG